jgi:plastocyanin
MSAHKMIAGIILILAVVASAYYVFFKDAGGTKTESPLTTPSQSVSGTSSEEVVVNIQNFSFVPSLLVVKAGTKVRWVNSDTAPHTVSSDSGDLLNSQVLASGQSFSFTFTRPGSVSYHCALHPAMKGTVNVTD